jgi:DNA-binding NarL/FixJ family response regulator
MGTTSTATFLVVDDHEPFRKALARALQPYGTVAHARTAAEGKTLVESVAWSALFIDVTLPDGNGLDVLAHAREHGCMAPALVLTVSHDPDTINRAFDYGARFLVKPGEWSHVDAFVRGAISGAERLNEVAAVWIESYHLSASEAAILVATARGATREEVIDERDIAVATFKRHVANLLAKTKDPSLLHAAVRLLRDAGHLRVQ